MRWCCRITSRSEATVYDWRAMCPWLPNEFHSSVQSPDSFVELLLWPANDVVDVFCVSCKRNKLSLKAERNKIPGTFNLNKDHKSLILINFTEN